MLSVFSRIKRLISCEEKHVMCEKGALWVEGSKPVSQEAASLPIISTLQKFMHANNPPR